MCGIAGIIAPNIMRHRDAVQRMTDALAHRGPDGQGHHFFDSCALGHRRLAIVDIVGGHQPMCNADGRVAVTFNGEIYGYQNLRRQLADYPFRTRSDTEVILALYERYGDRALQHLPGMFAFAIWDEGRQELLCARDRFGEKPLYYANGRGGEFIFASEIKGILASGLIEPVIDREAIVRYLQRQCARVDQSIYANIRALPPGHYLRYRQGQVQVARYWSLPEVEDDINSEEAVERFRALLRDSVRRQLVADVPVGAFLSGGLDSSTICVVASELAGNLRTFSFDFEGDHSEIPYARAVAKACRTRHVELAPKGVDIADQLWHMQRVYDEPFGDTSNIPTYLLAREARRHVKVVLTGDGGDELFGGYMWYKLLLWMEHEGRAGLLRWVAARVLNRLYRLTRLPGAAARELRIMGMAYGRQYCSVLEAHRGMLSSFAQGDLEQLGIVDEQPSGVPRVDDAAGSMDDVMRSDVEDYMSSDILTKIDRASMAHGLELRAPFLDVEFASFCLSLPYRLKVSTREDKIVLRQAFAAQWPAAIRRRSKQGFGAPLTRWLLDPAVRELERCCLQDPGAPIYEPLSYRGTQQILRRGHPIPTWTLLVLAVWLKWGEAGEWLHCQNSADLVGGIRKRTERLINRLNGAGGIEMLSDGG
jgi:asparagine synthase (glutamine-hydrolysing)